jgi:hypothetical protein
VTASKPRAQHEAVPRPAEVDWHYIGLKTLIFVCNLPWTLVCIWVGWQLAPTTRVPLVLAILMLSEQIWEHLILPDD